jgi:hypothetical protein
MRHFDLELENRKSEGWRLVKEGGVPAGQSLKLAFPGAKADL